MVKNDIKLENVYNLNGFERAYIELDYLDLIKWLDTFIKINTHKKINIDKWIFQNDFKDYALEISYTDSRVELYLSDVLNKFVETINN